MIEITLTQGKVALIDDLDYGIIQNHKWYATNRGNTYYAVARPKGKPPIYMHRMILGLVPGDTRETDHINHNGLDNRRENIRACSLSENHRNRVSLVGKTSNFLGVSWDKTRRKWTAHIEASGEQKNLGRFSFEVLAALAHDFAALRYHREFANFNF